MDTYWLWNPLAVIRSPKESVPVAPQNGPRSKKILKKNWIQPCWLNFVFEIDFFFHFRINHWATEFGEAIYETTAKATGLFDLQTVSIH